MATTPPPETGTAAPIPPSNRTALIFVFLVVFIDLLGFGIVLPLLPKFGDDFIEPLFGARNTPTGGLILGLLMAAFSFMQFIFAPIWGRISDRIGRRPVLLIGLLGSVAFYSLLGYASNLDPLTQGTLALTLLFLSRIGAGIAGATISTAQAVIADSTAPEKRKHGMAMIGAAFGIGFTFGPLIAALALTFFPENLGSVGYAAAGISFCALLLGLMKMPETREFGTEPPMKRKWLDLSAFRMVVTTPALAPVVLTFFLATLGFGGFEATLTLLNEDALKIKDPRNIMFIFAYVGFVLLLTQGYFYRKMAKTKSEVTLMTLGIILMGFGVLSLAGVTYVAFETDLGFTMLVILLLISLTVSVVGFAFLTPSAQALVSRRSEAGRQGEILGVNQSASAMARILGPVLGLTLYKMTATHMLPYLFGGGLVLLMLPLIPKIRRGGNESESEAHTA